MTTPGEITYDQQRTQNVRLALKELGELSIMDPYQIYEASEFIDDGSTCIDVEIAGKSYGIYGLSQMMTPHGDIIGVEDKEDYDEEFFSTFDSFRKWILSQTSQIN